MYLLGLLHGTSGDVESVEQVLGKFNYSVCIGDGDSAGLETVRLCGRYVRDVKLSGEEDTATFKRVF